MARGRLLFVVADSETRLYESLRKSFADEDSVEIVLDRRRGDRRRDSLPVTEERRRGPRRTHDIANDLRRIGWAVVRRPAG